MGDSSVKVAVRVRPFNNREKTEGAVLCVDMQGNLTRVYGAGIAEKEFAFDYSYWSHDEFVEDADSGMMVKDSPSSRYADQMSVFNDLGVGVLNNAFEGYHCCLFAYGQTGSGKSYSMVGYGKNKGIIPIACEEIFKRIHSVESKSLQCEVTASMLEIYNEQIQDLLKPPGERIKGGLKIREDPKTGVYVQDLSKFPCTSYDEISNILDKGNNNRTVAATQMNATSSRAHTVLTISFTQIIYDESGKPFNRKQSNINLVDLAGSERASKTGASGDTLKEGSNINKSLSTLGRVITALANKSSGSKEIVPYRESSLTRILQNALGGNSKTTMIAAISPATYNVEETLSTLRYAYQVKSIKNQAIVNETPQEKLIRELKEENERLKAMLEGKILPTGDNGSAEEQRLEFERQIRELQRAKEEAERTFAEKIQVTTEQKLEISHKPLPSKIVLTTPHLSNLNEDPLLSGHLSHSFKAGNNIIGKKNPSSPPGILIEGLGIGIDHCLIHCSGETYTIIPSQDLNLRTTLNGKILEAPAILSHQDRIRFGNHNFFLFVDPEELSSNSYDWEYAMSEAHEEEVKMILGKQGEELKAKEDSMKQKLEEELEQSKKEIEEEKAKLQELMKNKNNKDANSQKMLAEKEKAILIRQQQMMEEMKKKEQQLKAHEENRIAMENLKKELSHAIHQINEANERALLLGKTVSYRPELYHEGREIGKGLQSSKVRVKVVYPDLSEDFKIHWNIEKLDARLIDMQDICNQLEYGATIEDIGLNYDPFSDNSESFAHTYHLIGHAYLYLDTAYYLDSIEDEALAIINDQGGIKGTVSAAISLAIDGVVLDEYENMKDLIGKELKITIKIFEATKIPQAFCTDCFCQYTMEALNNEVFKTDSIAETNINPIFNYSKTHTSMITNDVTEEFLSRALIISVYGDMTRDRKAAEMMKIVQNSNVKSITMGHAYKYKDLDYDEDELFAEISEIPRIQVVPPLDESTIANDKSVYKKQMSIKDKELAKLEEEIKRKAKEDEKEIQKRLKNIEKKELEISQNNGEVPRKSACCITF